MKPIALLLRLSGLRRRPRPGMALTAAAQARTPLEMLLIDDDFYLAESAVIQPRAGARGRAGRL